MKKKPPEQPDHRLLPFGFPDWATLVTAMLFMYCAYN